MVSQFYFVQILYGQFLYCLEHLTFDYRTKIYYKDNTTFRNSLRILSELAVIIDGKLICESSKTTSFKFFFEQSIGAKLILWVTPLLL